MQRRRKPIEITVSEFRQVVTRLSRPVVVTDFGEPIGTYRPIDRRPIKPDTRGDAVPEVVT